MDLVCIMKHRSRSKLICILCANIIIKPKAHKFIDIKFIRSIKPKLNKHTMHRSNNIMHKL